MTRPIQPIRVAVLMGGPDAEREVSLDSGARVLAALKNNPTLDVEGYVVDRPSARELEALAADVVFPALHGPFGEGGELQKTLETAGIAFVGSDSTAGALAMDKGATKQALLTAKVPTARWAKLVAGEECPCEVPLVIKPIAEGSSVGVRICLTAEDVISARAELESEYPHLMAEAFIDGREITVGIVHGELLPLIEIKAATAFYDYEAKYHRSDTEYLFEPDLEPHVVRACNEFARTTWSCLGCRDVARVDFIVDDTGPWVLEVNTMPGFTDHSLVPLAARRAGMEMTELCSNLVMAAHRRGNEQRVHSDAMAKA